MSFCSRLDRPGQFPRSALTRRGATDHQRHRSRGEIGHVRPTSLPDGRHFVYLASRRDELVAKLASVDGSTNASLGTVQSQVVTTPSGHVVFVRDGTLLAQRLDVAAGRLTGDATVLAGGLTLPGRSFDGRFSAAPAMLVYLKANERSDRSELRIFDRTGKTVGSVDEPAAYTTPSLSPDGTRLAVARRESLSQRGTSGCSTLRVATGCG